MNSLTELITILALVTAFAACGDPSSESTTSTTGGPGGSGSTVTTGTNGGGTTSGGVGGDGPSGSSSSSSATTGSGSSGAGGDAPQSEVPTSSTDALFAYLKSGAYLSFPAESGVHPSTGPHGGGVCTYLTPALKASLEAGNPEHPIQSAVVKELYGSGSTVTGWAVAVKTQATSNSGKGWYWYEIYSTTDPSSAIGGANGVALCVNCHAAGKDFILTPIPLQ
jgi:hypothetical protein